MKLEQSISRAGPAVAPRWTRVLFAGLCALVLLAACDSGRGLQITAEMDEPHFRRGQQMLRSGQSQIALEAFLKVIDKRGGDAPESHLEAGHLYLNHIKDPIAAIYHFRKYLELRPNSQQAPQVRQLIEQAIKEFARTLPAQPLENQVDRLDLLEQMEKLKGENVALRAELERLGRPVPAATVLTQNPSRPPSARPGRAPSPPPAPASGEEEDFSAAALGPVQAAVPVDAPPASNVRTQPSRPAQQQPAGGRTYTVQAGDSLYKISNRFYGTGGRWPAILEANREQLRSERDLKVGMTLRIP